MATEAELRSVAAHLRDRADDIAAITTNSEFGRSSYSYDLRRAANELEREANRMACAFTWTPSTSAEYLRLLNVLPPAEQIGAAFLLGEPYDHDAAGRPRFIAMRARGPHSARIYERGSRPVTAQEFRALERG